jgi:Flp pilus assembly protein TadD
MAEYGEALRLNPNDAHTHWGLGLVHEETGDWDGAIVEYREALRLEPNDDSARYGLGHALRQKGDWDGVIAEYREVLRLNPNDDAAHYWLGAALEQKALQEYRAAYELKPLNPNYRKACERLAKETVE